MPAPLLYRGRLAPSPTGYLHLGHAVTFFTAQARAFEHEGVLVVRIEDLDAQRSRPDYTKALIEDMRWIGLAWQEGPDIGGPHAPYQQCERTAFYVEALDHLAATGAIYPCVCTRRDVERATQAPHAGEQDAVHSCRCREKRAQLGSIREPEHVNWRFRAAAGEAVSFQDGMVGPQTFVAGRDFGDFIVWRKDGVAAYQLAVVVDDAAMKITEVVRGADLLLSTAQQLLIYRALGFTPPAFYHCPLITDPAGRRLAKRAGAHSLRALRGAGVDPAALLSLVGADRTVFDAKGLGV